MIDLARGDRERAQKKEGAGNLITQSRVVSRRGNIIDSMFVSPQNSNVEKTLISNFIVSAGGVFGMYVIRS